MSLIGLQNETTTTTTATTTTTTIIWHGIATANMQ